MNKKAETTVTPSGVTGRSHRPDSVAYPVDIVFLSTDLNVGGAEKTIKNLARGLPRAEYRPHVIGLKPPGRLGEELDELGISWESLDAEPLLHPEVMFQLVNRLEEIKPDLLHSFQFYANIIGRTAASISGVSSIVSTVRDCDPSKSHLLLDGYTHMLVDREICVAPLIRDYVHRESGVPSEKLVSIPTGVDPDPPEIRDLEEEDLRDEMGVSEDDSVIMGAGRLTKQKGFDVLLNALPKIVSVHKDVVCVIFGEGPEEDRLREIIDNRDLSDHVILAGWTDRIREWLCLADLFVLPSRREGLPNVLLEAISMEVPFVASRTGGIPDLLRGSEQSGGLLVESDSARMLSSALETVLDRKETFQKGVQRFARVIREDYSISKMITRHHTLYKDLLSE